jgi:hypothetical protein
MNSAQFTVLVDSRPVRFAFFVDLEKFPAGSDRYLAILDELVNFNNIHWGGRSNPIIFFTGQTLVDEQWELLKASDPDRLVAFAPIPDQMLHDLDSRLNPCRILVDDQTESKVARFTFGLEGGVEMPPTKENLLSLGSRNLSGLAPTKKLLVCGFSENCDPDVRRFVCYNFGAYGPQWTDPATKLVRWNIGLELLLKEVETINYTVADVKSLADLVSQISGRMRPPETRGALPFVAPYQLASLFLPDWPWWELQHVYQIFIGDQPTDFSAHWNGAIWKKNWTATHTRQLWLPKKLIEDSAFRSSLHDWLTRYRRWDGGWRVEIFSSSLSAAEVTELFSEYGQGQLMLPTAFIDQNREHERFRRVLDEFSKYKRFIPWTAEDDVLRFSASFPNERVSLPVPQPLEGLQRNGNWMADVQLEHITPTRGASREQAWWFLPRSINAFWPRSFFRAPARVNASGRFSVEVESRDGHLTRTVKPHLKLQLPADTPLVLGMIAPPPFPAFPQDDARTKLAKSAPIIAHCRVSTKGYYFDALLSLFGNFWTAKSFCERRFWRELFSELAGHNTGEDEALVRKVTEMLKEHWPTHTSDNSQQAKLLSEEILHLVRGRLQGHYLSYKDCLQRRGRLQNQKIPETLVYPQGRTMVHRQGEAPLDIKTMEQGLDSLLALGILRLGIEKMCPRCKVRSWYRVNELGQQITCIGCGQVHALEAKETWSYALNSLARMSVSQGVLGVLHALTQLESSTIHSFFAFSPSLDLFRPGDKQPWHEIDIACIADGEFIIGEVKEGFVQKKDFEELAEIAEALMPQRAIMFLPLDRATKQAQELHDWRKEMDARLEPKGISSELFTLPEF